MYLMSSALREAEFGNVARARGEVKNALSIASTRDVQTLAALALARCGDSAHARAIADELQKQHPLDTTVNHYWLPVVYGYIKLQNGHSDAALKILEEASPYDLAFPNPEYSEGGTLYRCTCVRRLIWPCTRARKQRPNSRNSSTIAPRHPHPEAS